TSGTFGNALRGTQDGFVTVLAANGTSLTYSKFIGGDGNSDTVAGIAVNSGTVPGSGTVAGLIYLTGTITNGTNSPVIDTASTEPTYRTNGDAYLIKLNPAGGSNDVVYSTYIGGTSSDVGKAIAVPAADDAYVVGTSGSGDFTDDAIANNLGTNSNG